MINIKFRTLISLFSTKILAIRKCLFYPRYEVYRGYIVFAFSVIMFVCLSVCWFVCLSVHFFFLSKISKQLLDLGF